MLITAFYEENLGRLPIPILRARAFLHLCENKTLYHGDGELIVGERGPAPKAVPTFPELTCHSLQDLKILDSRPKTRYSVPDDALSAYEDTVIPYWTDRSLRDRLFEALPEEWHHAYEAGVFTEFMEQRAPGHTVLDDKIYAKGMRDFQADIDAALAGLDFALDPEAQDRREALEAMRISCERADPVRRAARGSRGGTGRGRVGSGGAGRAREDRRRLPARSGERPPRLPRGSAVLLVLPPRRDHGAQRVGRVQPGPPGSAPAAVLRSAGWRTGA